MPQVARIQQQRIIDHITLITRATRIDGRYHGPDSPVVHRATSIMKRAAADISHKVDRILTPLAYWCHK